MSAPEAFARHVLGLDWTALPPEAQSAARAFLLDTLAVGIAGRRAWLADEVLRVAQGWGAADAGVPSAPVFAGPELPAASAAYVNGFQIHCQEYDCVHEPAVVHPMAVIGAALTAEAAARPVSGKDFLAALTGAVDVAAGLGVAALSPIRFFRPATAGLFGAALGVARLRGASLDQALDALGYALAQAAGTMQAHVEGKPALPLQIAAAARAALVANDLAAAGIPGPHDVFEGPYGYLSLFETESDLAPVTATLGRVFRIAEVSYKPFPTGRAAQGGIVLMQRLRERGISASEIAAIRLIAPPLIARLVGRPAKTDMQVNYARLCFAYCGALALRTGEVRLHGFTPEALGDSDTLALAARISVEADGSDNPAAFTPQTLEARLTDGRLVTLSLDALYGSPRDPMRAQDIAAKRAECLAFGLGVARPDLDAALSEAVAALPGAASTATLTGLMAARPQSLT
ncbi:MmgE/PrpD family protein [Alkalicaulis satelles]|uniref:MmgE/PrpD family protein n=1 Tax=Alkalicaulis satelles TaxID=2609175 RepID=A0A5M6ZIF3_9PROT|nr:MmgE/PrpD family protein [Alkalicaulis satelles]KAA5804549.1 MmgE/PrpD family protein [Alkalicaulis satelles]